MNAIINFLLANQITFAAIVGCFGLIIGSFLNVVIYRLPLMLQDETTAHKFNLAVPRSHCPHCKTKIPCWLNIPLISYLYLRGRCKHCHAKISWRYPFVELLSAIAAAAVAVHFHATWQCLAALFFTWTLIPLVFIDIELLLLPDPGTILLLWAGLLVNAFWLFVSPQDAIIGGILGYSSFWIIAKIFYLLRRVEGMGYGDFKLLAAIGAWLGWQQLPYVVLIASVSGLIVGGAVLLLKRRSLRQPIPFGPFIALAGWLALFWR